MTIQNKFRKGVTITLAALIMGCAHLPFKSKNFEHPPYGIEEVTERITKQDGVIAVSFCLRDYTIVTSDLSELKTKYKLSKIIEKITEIALGIEGVYGYTDEQLNTAFGKIDTNTDRVLSPQEIDIAYRLYCKG